MIHLIGVHIYIDEDFVNNDIYLIDKNIRYFPDKCIFVLIDKNERCLDTYFFQETSKQCVNPFCPSLATKIKLTLFY